MNILEAFEILDTCRTPLSDSQVKNIILDCLKNLNNICNQFSHKIKPLIQYFGDSFEATTVLGATGIIIEKDNKTNEKKFSVLIKINKFLFYEELKDILINTIYHEMCHYLQDCEAVENGYYLIPDIGNTPLINERLSHLKNYFEGDDNSGHGECWLNYVSVVNKYINPVIKITAHPTDSDFTKYINFNSDKVQYELYCTNCNYVHSYFSFSPIDFKSTWVDAIIARGACILSGLLLDSKILNQSDVTHRITLPFIGDVTIKYPSNIKCAQCENGFLRIRFKDKSTEKQVSKLMYEVEIHVLIEKITQDFKDFMKFIIKN